MGKCIRDGKVAVLYSPGFGAGWSSWNDKEYKEFLLYDEKLVELVENDRIAGIEDYIKSVYPETDNCVCTLGAWDLRIQWMEPGTQFIITEYDGNEGIEYNYDTYWNIA